MHRVHFGIHCSFFVSVFQVNIETAFAIAEEELGIPRLLDVEDLMVRKHLCECFSTIIALF